VAEFAHAQIVISRLLLDLVAQLPRRWHGVVSGVWILFFLFRRAMRAGNRLAECEPTGMLRSPLFHLQTALLFARLGLLKWRYPI
jgi:hypothetical protein